MDIVNVSVRMPKELHQKMRDKAEKERRSLTAQILHACEACLCVTTVSYDVAGHIDPVVIEQRLEDAYHARCKDE